MFTKFKSTLRFYTGNIYTGADRKDAPFTRFKQDLYYFRNYFE